jgi:hypothetical protein
VPGNGDTQYRIDYALTDDQPATGINYYRLKQVDRDGAFVYSDIRTVYITTSVGSLVAVPNPTRDVVRLVGLTAEDAVEARLYDAAGRPVPMPPLTDDRLDLADLPPGVYAMRAGDRVARILKQ